MSEGRSAQCDLQRPCRPRRRGQSRCGRQRTFGAAREGTTHGSFVSDDWASATSVGRKRKGADRSVWQRSQAQSAILPGGCL